MDLTVTLKKPIEAHGNTIEVLTFGEPTGQLVVQLGEPFVLTMDQGIREVPSITVNYIVKMCKIPKSAAESIAPGDRKAVFLKLLPFLMPENLEQEGEESE